MMERGGGPEPAKVVVVRKKKSGHDEHHGGSWKVAYADFVTAMMAFFLVMWIMGMDDDVKDMVQGYFSNPVGFEKAYSGGANLLSIGNAPTNLDIQRTVVVTREAQQARFREVGEEIERKIRKAGLMKGLEARVDIVVTDEGLRIELMETGEGETFFDRASSRLKPDMRRVLEVVGPELNALPNDVVLEGHTDALPFQGARGYGNWELSSDRANAARDVLEGAGLGKDRITEIRAHADREPKNADDPLDPRNRRISILLPFVEDPEIQVVPGDVLGKPGDVVGAVGSEPVLPRDRLGSILPR